MPSWPPRYILALIALAASIAGAAVLTGMLAWIVSMFQLWKQADPLARIAYGLLFIVGIVLVSLGLAINRRSVKASGLGFTLDASGGEDDAPPASATVTTTVKAGDGQ